EKSVEVRQLAATARPAAHFSAWPQTRAQAGQLIIEAMQAQLSGLDAHCGQPGGKQDQPQANQTRPAQTDERPLEAPRGAGCHRRRGHRSASSQPADTTNATGCPGSLLFISWLTKTTLRNRLVCSSRAMYSKTAGRVRASPPINTLRLRGSG